VIETAFGDNALDHRGEPGPYEELGTLWAKAMETLGGGQAPPGPELVATAIATAIESDGSRLRWPVGQDAEMIASARGSADYDEFVAGMRAVLDLDW
jgi:hypothetical protein